MNNLDKKVMIITINAWDDNSGINTLPNIFKDWNPDNIYQIYTRSKLPNTVVCNNFFQISEQSLVKSIFHRNVEVGKKVYNLNVNETQSEEDFRYEKRRYSFFRRYRSYIFLFIRDLLWSIGKWKTKQLNDFISEANPDILFVPIYAYSYMSKIQKYIIEKSNKPVLTYIADDVYSYKQIRGNLLFYIYRFFLRKNIKKVMSYSKKLFVIAPKLKEEYDRIFSTDSTILTKGINIKVQKKQVNEINNPIKIVYAGKLNIGRWKSIYYLVEAIKKVNSMENTFFLEIYTTDNISRKIAKKLNVNNVSQIMGGRNYSEIKLILENADIVLFVESLSWRYKNIARLSFSTKITDYFESGKCILAIGDEKIAPIDYLLKHDAALVAYNKVGILKILNKIKNSESTILDYSKKAYNCGVLNHNETNVRLKLEKELIKYIAEGDAL